LLLKRLRAARSPVLARLMDRPFVEGSAAPPRRPGHPLEPDPPAPLAPPAPAGSEPVVFGNRFYTLRLDGPALTLLTPDGRTLLEREGLSLTTCEVFDLRRPLHNGAQVAFVADAAGLAPGDTIFVRQDIYGGLTRPRETFRATVKSVGADGEVGFAPPLPNAWFSHRTGVYLLKQAALQAPPALASVAVDRGDGGLRATTVEEHGPVVVTTRIACAEDSPRIRFAVDVAYRAGVSLYRQALVFRARVPLAELYLKNRTVEVTGAKGPSADDYWLWKEGCKLSDGAHCCYTLHNPGIASIEVRGARTPAPRLWINLEDYVAQRFRKHVRTHDDGFEEFRELSAPRYRAGESASYAFELNAGPEPAAPPRLMLTPHGHLASHVWTEHADKTHIRSNRAVYYGHEDVTDPAAATGGFVRHGHPVTKSVFFDNHLGIGNPPSDRGLGAEFGAMACYRRDPEIKDFFDQIHATGHEICLHTGDQEPVDNAHEAKALAEIAGRYRSRTWIDHKMADCRTCISADGLAEDTPYYMKDLWERHGIRYFWHWASEDSMLKNGRNLDVLHDRRGHATPTPVYWRHPTVMGPFWSWATNEAYTEHFSKVSIDALVANRGVSIHHGYYPFICKVANSFLYYYRDLEGRLIVTPQFDEVLAYMARLRDRRDLYIATVGELMDYWLALEQVEIAWTGGRSFTVLNRSGAAIPGFSFAVRAAGLTSGDVEFEQRRCPDGDIIAWLDLAAGASAAFATTA
jgi:hypothetical protein